MSWTTINLRNARLCAFCKYWWDPACNYILPRNEQIWMFEPAAKCRCMKKNMDTQAQSSCGMFRYKNNLSEL